jgi:hypothetical protein
MIRVVHPDPGVKKAPDPGSGSATLVKFMLSDITVRWPAVIGCGFGLQLSRSDLTLGFSSGSNLQFFEGFFSGLRIRIGSGLDPDSIGSAEPDSESGSGSRRPKMTHKSRNFKFMFWSVGWPLLRAEGSVADPDPGSGIGYLFDPGIRDEQPGSYFLELRNHLFLLFGVKIPKFFEDPGSGMETVRIRDPGWKKVGSGINIPDPQHWLNASSVTWTFFFMEA